MFRPGTNEDDVRMSDVLCDFCHREWTEDLPMIEGHRGRMICGNCLTMAYRVAVVDREPGPDAFMCTLCRENDEDRAALERTGEIGWASPMYEDAVACVRCIKRAAGTLVKDPDFDWQKPVRAPSE